MRRKYEQIPKGTVPRDKSQTVETMPKLAERSQRSRQRARLGIKSEASAPLKSPKKALKETPKRHLIGSHQSSLNSGVPPYASPYQAMSPKGPVKVTMPMQ